VLSACGWVWWRWRWVGERERGRKVIGGWVGGWVGWEGEVSENLRLGRQDETPTDNG
jgi:hypothetical protein